MYVLLVAAAMVMHTLTWIKIRIGRRRTIVILLLSRVNPRDLEVILRVAQWVLEFHRDFGIV
jgi:hypothetical protein